jgi:hypothetical protein
MEVQDKKDYQPFQVISDQENLQNKPPNLDYSKKKKNVSFKGVKRQLTKSSSLGRNKKIIFIQEKEEKKLEKRKSEFIMELTQKIAENKTENEPNGILDQHETELSERIEKSNLIERNKKTMQFNNNVKKMITQMTQLLSLKSTSAIKNNETRFKNTKRYEKSKVFVFNWNMHAKSGPKNLEEFEIWDSWVKQKQFAQNELIIFTCQESCQTIPKSFLFNSKKRWRKKLDKFLMKLGFKNVCDQSLNALSTMIYIREDCLLRLKGKVRTSKLRLGFGGLLPNKGAIINTFEFKDMKMACINVHLPHGSHSRDMRNASISKILKKLFKQIKKRRCNCIRFSKSKTSIISYLDFVSFSGDFNFTFQMSKREFIEILENGNLNMDNFEKLLQFDEYKPGTMKLSQIKKKSLLRKNFSKKIGTINMIKNQLSFDLSKTKNETEIKQINQKEKSEDMSSIPQSEPPLAHKETIELITLNEMLQNKKPKISLDKRQLKNSGFMVKDKIKLSGRNRNSLNLNLQGNKYPNDQISFRKNGNNYFKTDPLPDNYQFTIDSSCNSTQKNTSYISSENPGQLNGTQCRVNRDSLMKCSSKTVKKTVFGKENCNHLSNVTQKLHSRLSNFYLDDSSMKSPKPFEVQESHKIPPNMQLITPGKAFTHVVDRNLFLWKTPKNNDMFQKIDFNMPEGKLLSNTEIGTGFMEKTKEFKKEESIKSYKHILNSKHSKENIIPQGNKKKENLVKPKKITSKRLKRKLQKVKNNKLFEQEYRILEGKIQFPPTYKFFAGTSIYYLCNQRLPGYPDRIFYILKKNGAVSVRNLDYKSCFDIEISDHKPVYAAFELINRKILVNTKKNLEDL